MQKRDQEIAALTKDWAEDPRWRGVKRGYAAEDVVRLRGSVRIEHTLAKLGAEKLWRMCQERAFVNSLGALTGNQAMQQVKAGVPAIYLSGWQVAGDINTALETRIRGLPTPGGRLYFGPRNHSGVQMDSMWAGRIVQCKPRALFGAAFQR